LHACACAIPTLPEKPAKAAGEKKRKDPNAPKGALTAYIIFSNAKRDQVKKENPDIKFGEVAKKISEMWKNISASDKAKFDKAAQEDKKRYEREMADYNARGGAGASAPKKAKKAKAAPKAAAAESEGEDDAGSEEEDDEEDEE